MEEQKGIEKTSIKLNLIASLLFEIKEAFGEKSLVKDKINYLLKRGIDKDEDISQILGITKSHASKEKAILKKGDSIKNG